MTLWRNLLVAAGLILAVTAAQADTLEDIKSRGTLKVAVPQDFPPFGSVGVDLTPQGYDIDMARFLAERMGVDLELVPVTSANRIPYLQTGKVDLVISSLGKNAEREKSIDFSKAYAPFFLAVFGPEDMQIAGPEDLAGKSIAVTRGSVEDLALSEMLPADADLQRFEDNNTTISAYLSGQTTLIATGNIVMATIAAQNPGAVPVEKLKIKNSPCYIGLNKNEPALMEAVNALIDAGLADGELDALSQKWFKMPLPDLDA